MRGKNKSWGFTLIELLVVIAILAILSAVAISIYAGAQRNARDKIRTADIAGIARTLESTRDFGQNEYINELAEDYPNSIPKDPSSSTAYCIKTSTTSMRIPDPDLAGWTGVCPAGYVDISDTDEMDTAFTGTIKSWNVCAKKENGTMVCTHSLQGGELAAVIVTPAATVTPIATSTPNPTPTPACDTTGTLTNMLYGYWKFDEPSGTTANDSSGNNNVGTLTNSPARVGSTGGLVSALQFDGINDYVKTTNVPSFSSNTMSLAAWIKSSGAGDSSYENTIINIKESWDYYKFYWNNNSSVVQCQIDFVEDVTPGNKAIIVVSAPLSLNTWYHAICLYDGSAGRIYINGAASGTPESFAGTLSAPTREAFIGSLLGVIRYFNGVIDDVRIYNRALNTTERSNLYNGGVGCNLP